MREPEDITPHDPEFDRPSRNRPGPNADVVRFYQRLVVNPFLSLLVMVGLAMATRSPNLPKHVNPIGPVFVFGLLFGYPLVQIHCLDCGGTGRFGRWKRHACASVNDRWASGRLSNFPIATVQLVFWLMAIFFYAIAIVSFGQART